MERRVDACVRVGPSRSREDGKRTALGAMALHAVHLGTSRAIQVLATCASVPGDAWWTRRTDRFPRIRSLDEAIDT